MYHFIYESILLPSMRLDLRYRLFRYRDQLVKLKVVHGDKLSDDVFNSLFYSINSSINRLPFLSLSLFIEARREFETNNQLRQKVDRKIQLINLCEINETKKILKKTSQLAFYAFSLNLGSWVVYVVPILLVVYFIKQVFKLAFGLKRLIQELTFTTDHEFEKFDPRGFAAY